MLFFLLMNVKMPTIVGILTFMNRKISCLAVLSMIFIIMGPDCLGAVKSGSALSAFTCPNILNVYCIFFQMLFGVGAGADSKTI